MSNMRCTLHTISRCVLLTQLLCSVIEAFTSFALQGSRRGKFRASLITSMAGSVTLPTIDEASSDSFIKQVSHASGIISALSEADEKASPETLARVCRLLSAQFSHSDGIRGFFVTYLSAEGETVADNERVPRILLDVLAKADPEEMVPLACMNLIMPTAMTSIHTEPSLSAQSAKTAVRAKKILLALKDNGEVQRNCRAIEAAAKGEEESEIDDEMVEYWRSFFQRYDYKEEQKVDIALAVADIL